MSNTIVPEPISVYHQALRFKNAENILINGGHVDVYDLPFVVFVLSAFATELFMKCMYCLDGLSPGSKHNLGVLFQNLPGHYKRRLKKIWKKSATKKHIQGINFQFINRPGHVPIPIDLQELLNICGDSFVTFRYNYEGIPKDISIVSGLDESFYKAIIEIKPEWTPREIPSTRPTSPVR